MWTSQCNMEKGWIGSGGASGTRTPDLRIMIHAITKLLPACSNGYARTSKHRRLSLAKFAQNPHETSFLGSHGPLWNRGFFVLSILTIPVICLASLGAMKHSFR